MRKVLFENTVLKNYFSEKRVDSYERRFVENNNVLKKVVFSKNGTYL